MFKRKIKIGDFVKINSNCENTRKPVYKIYAIVKTLKGDRYVLDGYNGLSKHLFTKEELIRL